MLKHLFIVCIVICSIFSVFLLFRKHKVAGSLLLCTYILLGGIFYIYKKQFFYRGKQFIGYAQHLIFGIEGIRKHKTPTCSFTKRQIPTLKKDKYSLHRKAAQDLPKMSWIENESLKEDFIEKGVLVPIQNSEGYIVRKMNYGSPYVHSDTLKMLQHIETQFLLKLEERELPPSKFVITSATRTEIQQNRLRKRSPRTATSGKSSHSYGASIDIAKVYGHHCDEARDALAEVLIELQKKKILYLCPESITIHVTVRDAL